MTDGDSASAVKELTSQLERLVDARLLILFLTFFFYLDIWFLHLGIQPTEYTLATGVDALKKAPLYTVVIFFLSYSLLMAGFFPVLRKFIGLARYTFQDNPYMGKHSPDRRRLSDWALAFIAFSIYDAIYGYFFPAPGYNGIADFLFNFLKHDGPSVQVFRISMVILWCVCFSFAIEIDDHTSTNK